MLQFYVPMDFLEPSLFEIRWINQLMYYFPQQKHQDRLVKLIQLVFRTALVLLTGERGARTLECSICRHYLGWPIVSCGRRGGGLAFPL